MYYEVDSMQYCNLGAWLSTGSTGHKCSSFFCSFPQRNRSNTIIADLGVADLDLQLFWS